MRPRVFPAEDIQPVLYVAGSVVASMRPRVFPAEDVLRNVIDSNSAVRFNEAAGIPRGRRVSRGDARTEGHELQ